MHSAFRLAAALAVVVMPLFWALPVSAQTPKDTLVQGWAIDDVISLDPAEIFELTASEIAGNSYDRLIGYDLKDVSKLFGVVADSWDLSADGKTLTFRVRKGMKFASGNRVTAEDAVFSLRRAVILGKQPAFILTQFGLTKDNVKDMIRQTSEFTFDFEMDKPYAPSFVLYCLSATVASVVDKKLVLQHEKDGDLGHQWLRTNYAGSGPFAITGWNPGEEIVMERNPNYWGKAPTIERTVYRHIPDPATERLMLENGEIDIARKLGPEEIKALRTNPDIQVQSGIKGAIFYLGLNQKNPILAKPKVRQALKFLVDYQAIADSILNGGVVVHQAFLPRGFLGALEETPYSLNVAQAKALLKEAGHEDGFSVTMDVRNTAEISGMAQAIQQTFAEAGITVDIILGDGKETLIKYRDRKHDIYIGRWGPDYQDPHTNANTFARNIDNSDNAQVRSLAWRNAWNIPVMTATTKAAALERDKAKRAQIYLELQQEHQRVSPFVIMFQEIERAAMRKNIKGFVIGPSFDSNAISGVVKD